MRRPRRVHWMLAGALLVAGYLVVTTPDAEHYTTGDDAVLAYHVDRRCEGSCPPPSRDKFGTPEFELFLVRADATAAIVRFNTGTGFGDVRIADDVDFDAGLLKFVFHRVGGNADDLVDHTSGLAYVVDVESGPVPAETVQRLDHALANWTRPAEPTSDYRAHCMDCGSPGFYAGVVDGEVDVVEGRQYLERDPARRAPETLAYREVVAALDAARQALELPPPA